MADEAEVTDNAALGQYELKLDGQTALTAYRMAGNEMTFYHTVVPEALEGHGVGKRLVKGALADVRRRGLKVVPLCTFVHHYIATHAEEQDLLA